MALDITMATWCRDVQLEFGEAKFTPPDTVQHGNVAAVLFSLSYDSLPCTRLLNGVGVHMYICTYVCMYVCDQKKFEWQFSGQLTLSTLMVDFPL